MSVRTISARAERCANARPPTAAAEAVARKPRRDRLEGVAITTRPYLSAVVKPWRRIDEYSSLRDKPGGFAACDL